MDNLSNLLVVHHEPPPALRICLASAHLTNLPHLSPSEVLGSSPLTSSRLDAPQGCFFKAKASFSSFHITKWENFLYSIIQLLLRLRQHSFLKIKAKSSRKLTYHLAARKSWDTKGRKSTTQPSGCSKNSYVHTKMLPCKEYGSHAQLGPLPYMGWVRV